jgi:hypothetical protein
MRAGLTELDRWLADRVRTGLAAPALVDVPPPQADAANEPGASAALARMALGLTAPAPQQPSRVNRDVRDEPDQMPEARPTVLPWTAKERSEAAARVARVREATTAHMVQAAERSACPPIFPDGSKVPAAAKMPEGTGLRTTLPLSMVKTPSVTDVTQPLQPTVETPPDDHDDKADVLRHYCAAIEREVPPDPVPAPLRMKGRNVAVWMTGEVVVEAEDGSTITFVDDAAAQMLALCAGAAGR